MDRERHSSWRPAQEARTFRGDEVLVSAVAAASITALAFIAGLLTSGPLALVSFGVAVVAGLYLVHVISALAGWLYLSRLLSRTMASTAEGEHQLQVRVPIAPESEPVFRDPLFDALNRRLGPDGSCGWIEERDAELRYFVEGGDRERLTEAVLETVAGFTLPPGAHLWRPATGRRGERLDL